VSAALFVLYALVDGVALINYNFKMFIQKMNFWTIYLAHLSDYYDLLLPKSILPLI
jgi:hypothetical protein